MTMEFRDVQRRVFDLYAKQCYELGIEVLEEARSRHPEQDARLTFWQACLFGRWGRPGDALAVLSSGLDRGCWWDSRMLADSDLDSVRELAGWSEIETRSGLTAAKVATDPPEPRIRLATRSASGTLVTLHGSGADPMQHAAEWEAAAPDSWTVITPAGNVPMSTGRWSWPFDLPVEPLTTQLETFDLISPLVLSGWSQGGGMAASWAWSGGHQVDGLLLIGPGLKFLWDPGAHPRVPTYQVIGEKDLNVAGCRELHNRLTSHGVPAFLDERPGLGHEPPENLQGTIGQALDWILGSNEG